MSRSEQHPSRAGLPIGVEGRLSGRRLAPTSLKAVEVLTLPWVPFKQLPIGGLHLGDLGRGEPHDALKGTSVMFRCDPSLPIAVGRVRAPKWLRFPLALWGMDDRKSHWLHTVPPCLIRRIPELVASLPFI